MSSGVWSRFQSDSPQDELCQSLGILSGPAFQLENHPDGLFDSVPMRLKVLSAGISDWWAGCQSNKKTPCCRSIQAGAFWKQAGCSQAGFRQARVRQDKTHALCGTEIGRILATASPGIESPVNKTLVDPLPPLDFVGFRWGANS
jgi:hypothetical protein